MTAVTNLQIKISFQHEYEAMVIAQTSASLLGCFNYRT